MNQENFKLPEFSVEGADNRAHPSSRRDLLEQSKLSRLPQRKPFAFDNAPFYRLRLVCDECARPLHLYGENFIESYSNGKANIMRCLCDLHAAELEVSE